MTKITVKEDCGNAPKKLILKDLNIAFVEGNIDFIANNISDDFAWNRIGIGLTLGKDSNIQALKKFSKTEVDELVIKNILTHGKIGAVEGTMKIKEDTFAFCNTYRFTGHDKNAKVKEINSYVIKM